MSKVYVPGTGPIGAKIMIVTEGPSSAESAARKFLVGQDHRELDRLLQEAGINKANCWLTGVSKFHVPDGPRGSKIPYATRAKQADIDLQQQVYDLQEEVNGIKPNVILALGKTALWAFSGRTEIGDYRGSILFGMGRKFIPTYNPFHLNWQSYAPEFIGYWNRQIILFDFKRALAQSQFPEIKRPLRNLEICTSSYQLAQFRDKYKHKLRMSVDIEANGTCVPVCIGLSLDKSHGICVPLWNCDGISHIPDSDMVQIWIILAQMLWEKEIVGQNFNYDRDKIGRLGFVIRKLVADTMYKAQAINPELPKGLGFNTSIYTEEPFYKNEGMYQGSISDLMTGCARDACVTLEVDANQESDVIEIGQKAYYEKFLMRLPEFYYGMEQQGFKVDHAERDRLLHKYIEWDERVRFELYQLTGTEINVNSNPQIKILLFENFGLPRKDSTGEEAITELLNSASAIKKPEHRKVCELILEGRRVRKSISTYLMAMPDFDGRMRTTYFPCLETGRSSTGQQDPPIRPTIEVVDENGKKKKKNLGIAFQTMTKHGDIGADIRGMYIPDDYHWEMGSDGSLRLVEEDETFVQADSSQAEARVVWLLAGDEEALRLVDEIDYHALTATWFFGGTEQDYSKKVLGYEHPIRFAGKTLRHAGHLGAGKRRAAISVNTDARKYKVPIAITEAVAERALKIFHSRQPRIQGVFQNGVIEVIKKTRTLVAPLPHGLRHQDVPNGGRRTFYERFGDELFRQAFSYIPQRAVSDNTKMAGLRIKERIPGIKIVMEAHDALLFSVPDSKIKEYCLIIKEEMERPIDFTTCSLKRRHLSIPCEIEIGKNYRDLKTKFKDFPIVTPSVEVLQMPPKTITEQFLAPVLAGDSPLTDLIYHHTVTKKGLEDNEI